MSKGIRIGFRIHYGALYVKLNSNYFIWPGRYLGDLPRAKTLNYTIPVLKTPSRVSVGQKKSPSGPVTEAKGNPLGLYMHKCSMYRMLGRVGVETRKGQPHTRLPIGQSEIVLCTKRLSYKGSTTLNVFRCNSTESSRTRIQKLVCCNLLVVFPQPPDKLLVILVCQYCDT